MNAFSKGKIGKTNRGSRVACKTKQNKKIIFSYYLQTITNLIFWYINYGFLVVLRDQNAFSKFRWKHWEVGHT